MAPGRGTAKTTVGQKKEGALPGGDLGLLCNQTGDAGLPGQGAVLGLTLSGFHGDFPLW